MPFVLIRMSERAIQKKKMTYNACFINYSNAFDTVRYEPLIDLLKAADVNSNDV